MPYPTPAEYACAFFDEGVRHLTDAHLLHLNARYAACVQSRTHGSEKALKAHILVSGGWYWMDKIKTTHQPFQWLAQQSQYSLLAPIRDTIRVATPPIEAGIVLLEKLTPFKEDRENCEYPYLKLVPNPTGTPATEDVLLHRPELVQDEAKSLDAYRAVHAVISFVRDQNPEFQSHVHALPPVL